MKELPIKLPEPLTAPAVWVKGPCPGDEEHDENTEVLFHTINGDFRVNIQRFRNYYYAELFEDEGLRNWGHSLSALHDPTPCTRRSITLVKRDADRALREMSKKAAASLEERAFPKDLKVYEHENDNVNGKWTELTTHVSDHISIIKKSFLGTKNGFEVRTYDNRRSHGYHNYGALLDYQFFQGGGKAKDRAKDYARHYLKRVSPRAKTLDERLARLDLSYRWERIDDGDYIYRTSHKGLHCKIKDADRRKRREGDDDLYWVRFFYKNKLHYGQWFNCYSLAQARRVGDWIIDVGARAKGRVQWSGGPTKWSALCPNDTRISVERLPVGGKTLFRLEFEDCMTAAPHSYGPYYCFAKLFTTLKEARACAEEMVRDRVVDKEKRI